MSLQKTLSRLLFTNRSPRQTVVKNAFRLLLADVFAKGITALSLLYLAYLLGTQQFGVYSFITSYAGFFVLVVDYGLIQYTIRTHAQQTHPTGQLISHTLLLKICLALTIFFMIWIISNRFSTATLYLTQITLCICYLITNSFSEYLRALYRLEEKMEKEATLKIIHGLLYALGICGYALWGTGITTLFVMIFTVSIINLVITLFMMRKTRQDLSFHFSKSIFSDIFRIATPFAISALLISVYMNADQVLLGFYGQHESLGIYAFAYKITLIFTTITAAVFSALFPHATKHATIANVRHYFLTGTKRILRRNTPIIVILLCITYLGHMYTPTLLGSYEAVRPILYILRLYCLLEPLGYRGYTNLISIGADRKNMLFLAIAAGINIIANLVLIPKYGYRGAAWTTVGSYLCYTLLCFFYLTRGADLTSKG